MAGTSTGEASKTGGGSFTSIFDDLEAYLGNYSGVTRVRRLAFIAAASPAQKKDALRLAAAEVKRSTNTALYLELVALSGEDGGLAREDSWVEQVDRKANQQLDKLESDLNSHKTSLVKESIRVRPRSPSHRRRLRRARR